MKNLVLKQILCAMIILMINTALAQTGSSRYRIKNVTNFGWKQRVVPTAAYMDSTFSSLMTKWDDLPTLVPYTGATTSLNLGSNSFSVGGTGTITGALNAGGSTNGWIHGNVSGTNRIYTSGNQFYFVNVGNGDAGISAGTATFGGAIYTPSINVNTSYTNSLTNFNLLHGTSSISLGSQSAGNPALWLGGSPDATNYSLAKSGSNLMINTGGSNLYFQTGGGGNRGTWNSTGLRIGSGTNPTCALDVTGNALFSSSVGIGALPTSSLSSFRLVKGTGSVDMGQPFAGYGGLWVGSSVPTSGNYVIASDGSNPAFNGATTLAFQIANNTKLLTNSGGIVVTGSLDVSSFVRGSYLQANGTNGMNIGGAISGVNRLQYNSGSGYFQFLSTADGYTTVQMGSLVANAQSTIAGDVYLTGGNRSFIGSNAVTLQSSSGSNVVLNGGGAGGGVIQSLGGTQIMATYSTGITTTRRFSTAKGANVASANDLTLGFDGNVFHITGSTTINAITTSNWQAGSMITLIFDSNPTVKNNTAGGAGTALMKLAADTDFSATVNDVLTLVYDGTYWFECSRSVN